MGEEAEKKKILFVCTHNKMRSRTAEEMYKADRRFEVRSAGVSDDAVQLVNLELLTWADWIVVMENYHFRWIRECFPVISRHKRVICLDIPDEFWFMDPELVDLIKSRFERVYDEQEGERK